MKILFLHGLEGTPNGSKVRYLKDAGFNVIAPKLPKASWEESKARAEAVLKEHDIGLIIGSSRGGALACDLDTDVRKVLIAPAWNRFCVKPNVDTSTIILHCEADDLVDYRDSEKLKRDFGAALITIGVNHRMSDPETLACLADLVATTAKRK
mgnify:CR=1 FL=1|jgi:predicted esterase YcpF (UPF0227 family)